MVNEFRKQAENRSIDVSCRRLDRCRLVTRNDRIVGMAFVNDTPAAGRVLAMIQRQQKLSALPVDILSPGFDFNRLR